MSVLKFKDLLYVWVFVRKPLKNVYSEREIGGPEKDLLSERWRRALKRTC
jgi:hypothetical protein